MDTLQEIIEFDRFDNLEWCARQIVEGFITGLHKSPYHGFSVEFAEHRLYNQGESTRHIDWKLFARTDKLFTKQFEEETNMRCNIVIDTSSSMLFPTGKGKNINKLTFSIYSAAALIHLLRRQRDAVGLTLFSDHIELQTESRLSESHAKMLYAELDKCLWNKHHSLNQTTNIAETLHLTAELMPKRSLIVIFSDLFGCDNTTLFSAIEHLKHNRHEVVIFHITDHEHEMDLDYPNRPICFVDMETGEKIKLTPNQIRDHYQSTIGLFMSDLRTKCGQYGIELVSADIRQNFADILIPFLIKRTKAG